MAMPFEGIRRSITAYSYAVPDDPTDKMLAAKAAWRAKAIETLRAAKLQEALAKLPPDTDAPIRKPL
jgi:hypothetical protein